MNIVAWGNAVPWVDPRQVEQDLIISRALVELFNDPFLSEQLRFRGGTALNKLHFSKPLRYSEDIDLTRTTEGPIGPVLDRVREILEPWMGRAKVDMTRVAPKLRFRMTAADGSQIRLKVEIQTRERIAYDGPLLVPFSVSNPWFTGSTEIPTFSREEMLATKLRALLQRDKGRDLIDLSHAVDVFYGLKAQRTVDLFKTYLEAGGDAISRAEAEERMLGKLENKDFLADVPPLLAADEAEKFDEKAGRVAFVEVFTTFIKKIPGDPWALTREKATEFGLPELAD